MQNSFTPNRIDSAKMSSLIEENLNVKSMDYARLPGGSVHMSNWAGFTSGLRRAGDNGITCARFSPQELGQQIENCLEPFRKNKTPLNTPWV